MLDRLTLNFSTHEHPPELIVGVSHLVSPQLGHEDLNDAYEDDKVDLSAGESRHEVG